MKKLQELSTSDKDVIEALQKKLTAQKIDFDTISQKYQSLLRNYEGVANFAASDKAEFTRLKNGREAAEKELIDLKKKLDLSEGQNQEMRPIIENLNF